MTCGYSPGDMFPILRDDIPTLPRGSRESLVFLARTAPLARSLAADCAGEIRTVLPRIIAASGEFMGRIPRPRALQLASISEISPRYFLRLVKTPF